VIRNAVPGYKRDEVGGSIACQRRLREMRIGGEKIFRPAMQVREVTTATSGDQDFLADTIGVFEHDDATATFASLYGAYQARSAGAQDNRVERLWEHVRSFRVRGQSCKWEQALPSIEEADPSRTEVRS
jgi:hypothetical protein